MKLKVLGLLLAITLAATAQRPGSPVDGRGRGPAPTSMFPWWESPNVTRDLKLTEDQTKQIKDIQAASRTQIGDYFKAAQKADRDLEAIYNEDHIDWQRAADKIEIVTHARADLTRALANLSLRLRNVLTIAQWQELQRRQPEMRREGRRGGTRYDEKNP